MVKLWQKYKLPEPQRNCIGTGNYVNFIMTSTVQGFIKGHQNTSKFASSRPSLNPFSAGTAFKLMQTGWIQASNSAAGLRFNLFATQSIFTHKKQAEFTGFKNQTTILSIFRKLPSIQRVKYQIRVRRNGSAFHPRCCLSKTPKTFGHSALYSAKLWEA